jgi:serine/threonine protein kinase
MQTTPVAVKTFFSANVDPDSALLPKHVSDKMLHEAANLCTLNHPNVVRVFGTVSECGWFVMELCPGGSLKSLLHDSQQVLHPMIQMRFAAETATGIAYLHHSGIVHGALKAANLLLTDSVLSRASIKITDFGMVEAKKLSLSHLGSAPLIGDTLRHTAPELLAGGLIANNFASDVFSLSITLWEIFERRTPFGTKPDAAVAQGIKRGTRPGFHATPSSTVAVLKGCWAQDVTKRWSATRAAVELIDLAELPISLPPPEPTNTKQMQPTPRTLSMPQLTSPPVTAPQNLVYVPGIVTPPPGALPPVAPPLRAPLSQSTSLPLPSRPWPQKPSPGMEGRTVSSSSTSRQTKPTASRVQYAVDLDDT